MSLVARPIQRFGRIAVAQSAKDGMNPRSSRTCCSPTHRVGMTRPVERVIVAWRIVRALSESGKVTELNGPLYSILSFTYASSFELQNKSKFSLTESQRGGEVNHFRCFFGGGSSTVWRRNMTGSIRAIGAG